MDISETLDNAAEVINDIRIDYLLLANLGNDTRRAAYIERQAHEVMIWIMTFYAIFCKYEDVDLTITANLFSSNL